MEQLEVIAFFSGYSLLYVLIHFLGSTQQAKKLFNQKAVSLLPLAYAFVGLLFIGFQFKKISPDFSTENIQRAFYGHYLLWWGALSLLFFIPALYKKTALSFLHSLVFFYLIARDIFIFIFQSTDGLVIKNEMNLYTRSLLVNMVSFVFILCCSSFFARLKKRYNR